MRQITGMMAAAGAACVMALTITGCMKTSPVAVSSSDQQYFTTVAQGNDAATHDMAVSDETALNDGQMYSVTSAPMPPSIQSVADGDDGHQMHPIKWGRFIHGARRLVTGIDMQGDSVAVVTVQVTYTGTYVVYGTLNGVPDTVSKPYTETLHRLFRFVRVSNDDKDDDADARLRWHLDGVSLLSGGTGGTAIAITKLQVIAPTGDTITVTSPDTYFLELTKRWMHDLPLWDIDVQVTVNVTVHSTDRDTDVVTLHHCPKEFGLHRTPMMLVSQTGDSLAGFTRVYSATFAVPGNGRKLSQLLLSATTHESLYSIASTDFESSVWSLPYQTP